MNIVISWHAIVIALCWVLPAQILLGDISRNGASSDTWESATTQITSLYLGAHWAYVLAMPLIVGVIIEINKVIEDKLLSQ